MKRFALFVLFASCGIDTAVEKYRTLPSGVYGQARTGCDVLGCTTGLARDAPVTLRTLDGGASSVPGTSTDSNGFYELSGPPGSYLMCIYGSVYVDATGYGPCVAIELDGGFFRFDHMDGAGGGHWSSVPVP